MNVSQSCIVNCFRKGGVGNHKFSDGVETVDASIDTFGLDRQTFDAWVQVDDDLPGHCVLTENEIAESVLDSVKPNEEG